MDYILIDGDTAKFDQAFGDATVDVQDGTLTAQGHATMGGSKVCVEGDEASVVVAGCTYSTPTYSIKGSGTLTIDSLGGDQVASQTTAGGTAVLLVGSTFTAKFTILAPAQQPQPSGPPTPGPTAPLSGTGSFETTNDFLRGE